MPPDTSFSMDTLLKFLEDVISSEEMVALYTRKKAEQSQTPPRVEKKQKLSFFNGCMYCNESLKLSACTKYKTPQERSQYLREHKLCLICASPQHATSLWTNFNSPGKKTTASKDLQKVKATTKTLGKKTPTYEELSTAMIEIEAMLNTRPLLYVDSGPNADQILRSIDFLQNEFEIPFPLSTAGEDDEDPT
ncbi:hypothetical protein ANCDUO_11185 [Ancylostoma duodenale]|uniref:Uncharacterized protein n=1 Tax=Ancylostoma duodenale TaxID=51022 RepID=A0A0C2GI90_9BILA|nr:hypothetical protein ANCDUO_11185 [Ancylostoma duodenale]